MKKFNSISLNHVGIDYVLDVYGDKDNCWFKAVDIAEMLDIRKDNAYRIVESCDECDKKVAQDGSPHIMGGNTSNTIFVSEDGLYEILMQSRKPLAKQAKSTIKMYLKQLRVSGYAAVGNRTEKLIAYLRSTGDLSDSHSADEIERLYNAKKDAEEKYDLLRRQYDQDGFLNAERFGKTYREGLEEKSGYLVHVLMNKLNIIYRRGKKSNHWILKEGQQHFFQKGCSIAFDMEGAAVLLKALKDTTAEDLKQYAKEKWNEEISESCLW